MDYKRFRLRSFTTLESYYMLECGSYYELPLKYCEENPTDEDIIFYKYDICAIPWNRNPPKNTKCTVLRIDSKHTPSGFARLTVDRDNNTEDNPTYFRRPPVLRDIKTGGPSFPYELRLTHEGRAFFKVNQNAVTLDLVFAVYCPYWPVEAEEWRKRKRFHGWPDEKLIVRITRGGCHFVSKLRTWSSCDDTEWRFSFSKAELLLIHSWTPDQKYVYHVVRLLKRRISEYCGGNENKAWQTYYFKTLMFWACEEFPPEFWEKQNITTCVDILLLQFIRCLEKKSCPSYFIPECNIMSHLKGEDSFEKELQTLQSFVINGISIVAEDITPEMCRMVFETPFEYLCLTKTLNSFPLNIEFNRCRAQYLSECDWFLPGMKTLHTAIDAHLRLMSVDSVNQRETSKDYATCVANFDLSLSKHEDFVSYECLNGDKSLTENWIRMFVRKVSRNSVQVYSRISYEGDVFCKMLKESYPSLLQSVTSAYRANFYFTAMQSYNESLSECKNCFEVLENKAEAGLACHNPSELSSYIPLLMCNSFSQIFDEHLQVILGFATLYRNISFSNSLVIIVTSHEVCLKVHSWEFLKYLNCQCELKLYSKVELTDSSCFITLDLHQPRLSQLMDNAHSSAAILLAALRQSRTYKNPFMCILINDHNSQRKYQHPKNNP